MLNETKKLIEEVDELMDLFKKQIDFDTIKHMNVEAMRLFMKALQLMDTSKIVILAQAGLMDEMNNKLDKLLTKIEA
jgi:hypothetical protein